jgi:hypothetical protein
MVYQECCGMQRRIIRYKFTDVSEEHTVSIFKTEEARSKQWAERATYATDAYMGTQR